MKLKHQIFRNTFLALVVIWGLFLLYSYNIYHKDLQIAFNERGQEASERLIQLTADTSQVHSEKLDYLAKRAFNVNASPETLPEKAQQQLDQDWGLIQGKNKLLGLSYYDSNHQLLGRWGANAKLPSGYPATKIDNNRAFEELKGYSYLSCRRTCYLRVSRPFHPHSFHYGLLEMNIPLSVIFNQFKKLKQTNVTLFTYDPALFGNGKNLNFNVRQLIPKKYYSHIEYRKIVSLIPTIGRLNQAIPAPI